LRVADFTIDFSAVAVAVIGGVFTVIQAYANAQINKLDTDKQSATVLEAAMKNSLGALQQATEGAAKGYIKPVTVQLPAQYAGVAVAVQYVLDHAGDEAARFGLTPEAIAEKIIARIGVASIQSNIQSAAAPGPTTVPLGVVPTAATK
jgi:hypothetical protein